MKIKEVCGKTGLTERTVRFYVEQSLLCPAATEKNDRSQGHAWAWRWPSWSENLCMVLFALLGWKVFLFLYRPLDEFLFSAGLSALSVLALPMLYLILALPVSLVLGRTCGRWLREHLVF